jgi:hypothetical protein
MAGHEEWETVKTAEFAAPATAFWRMMEKWIREPQLVLPPVLGGELVEEVDADSGAASQAEWPYVSSVSRIHPTVRPRRQLTRKLIPRRAEKDREMLEDVVFLGSDDSKSASCCVAFVRPFLIGLSRRN